MKLIIILIVLSLTIIYFSRFIVNQKKREAYLKAGKKWEDIVKELTQRK